MESSFLKKPVFLFILVPIVSANIFSPVFNSQVENCGDICKIFLLKCFLIVFITNRRVNLLLKLSVQLRKQLNSHMCQRGQSGGGSLPATKSAPPSPPPRELSLPLIYLLESLL